MHNRHSSDMVAIMKGGIFAIWVGEILQEIKCCNSISRMYSLASQLNEKKFALYTFKAGAHSSDETAALAE